MLCITSFSIMKSLRAAPEDKNLIKSFFLQWHMLDFKHVRTVPFFQFEVILSRLKVAVCERLDRYTQTQAGW